MFIPDDGEAGRVAEARGERTDTGFGGHMVSKHELDKGDVLRQQAQVGIPVLTEDGRQDAVDLLVSAFGTGPLWAPDWCNDVVDAEKCSSGNG